MGNANAAQSSPANPNFAVATRAFTKQELADLKSLFESLAAQSHSAARFVSPQVFQGYFGIRGGLGERMFILITQGRNDGKLTFNDLVIAKATYEKGIKQEIEEFIYKLCDVTGDGLLDRSDLEEVIKSISNTIFTLGSVESSSGSTDVNLEVFMKSAIFSEEDNGNPGNMTLTNFKNWCSLLPSVRKFLGSLLTPPDPVRPGFQVPKLQYPETLSPDMLILKKEYAWHIGGALSQHEVEDWKLLYHSAVNGLSFNTFLANILNESGKTVLVVKDKEGYIYGGYASQPWERHNDFYGDMKSFLFQLYPQASIFRPTGANSNLQWCAVNFSSDSIPNGIGFGGQANHFGLFLSSSLEQGHTFTCSTFDSPCLSTPNRMQPDVIECWGIVSKGSQNEQSEVAKGSVLERFKEDRNMLKMVGLANASE